MTDDKSPLAPLSRRRFLHLSATAAGSAVLAVDLLGSGASAATSKVSKQTVNYQQAPRGQARCAACSFFQPPSSCNYVDGAINPSGWCTLFQPKR